MEGREVYEFGPFRLDAGARRLLRDSRPIVLTAKAFDLLLALVENRGPCRETLDMDPAFGGAHLDLGLAYLQKSMFAEALRELRQAATLLDDRSITLAVLGYASALAGERAVAYQILDQLRDRARQQDISSLHTAYVHVGLGNVDQAFEWLDRAYLERAGLLVFLKVEPIFDPLRSDPRFVDLLRRLRFPA